MRLQPVNNFLRLAVLPAVVLQHGNRAFHTALKAADGVEAAHLRVLYCLHCSGLVAIERELHGKGRKKCCQTQAHALLEGDLPLAVLQSLPPPFRLVTIYCTTLWAGLARFACFSLA